MSTEDDLRLAFAAGMTRGAEEAMLDEGKSWPTGAEHAPTCDEYIAVVKALRKIGGPDGD